MARHLIFVAIILALIAGGLYVVGKNLTLPTLPKEIDISLIPKKQNAMLTISSSIFENNGVIPSKYTCDAENVNPPLSISNVPEGTRSLVLIMDDPDAVKPAGKIWDHWVKFNIPPTTDNIAENTEPEGTSGKGSGNNLTYRGPCPPDGEHRYFFKLYALDTTLNLPEGTTKAEVEKAMEGHIIGKTELIGRYTRTQ